MAPKFSKLVSKHLEASFRAKYALTPRKYALTARKEILKNIVTRFLNNFRIYGTPPSPGVYRRRANREVQTVNWEGRGEGAVERGAKSSLKKAHKPWIMGKKGAQTVN